MRRFILIGIVLLLAAAAALLWWRSRPLPVLTVTTWAGVYGRAQAAAQMQPYGAANRINVRIAEYDGSLDELRRAVSSGVHTTDVLDLELPAAVQACAEGLLEPIDAATLPPGDDGTPAARDFLPGMTGPCWVASAVYAQMMICLPCRPDVTDLAGLFALAARDEKIGLHRGAKINLEMALLADGVKPQDVYRTLETDAGLARAFARLDTIKRNILWWNSPREAIALLTSGQTRIGTALTAEVETQARQTRLPLFGPQFYEADVLAIPKGDPKKDMALDYLRFATSSAPLAGMARFAPYAPPRRSSRALVAGLPAGPTRDFVAAQGDALERGFAVDDAWWRAHGAALEQRFTAWLEAH